jgi:hypothetical protein
MPAGASILTVQVQNKTITLWALVNTKNSESLRTFEIFGTGASPLTTNLVII